MNPFNRGEQRHRERGEGKIGCIVTLLIFATAVAVGFKAIPVYWGNYELQDAAKDMASRASVLKVDAIELQLRAKARDFGVVEAVAPGAIKATKSGDYQQGICTVRLSYKRVIDLFGFYKWTVETKAEISSPYMAGL